MRENSIKYLKVLITLLLLILFFCINYLIKALIIQMKITTN